MIASFVHWRSKHRVPCFDLLEDRTVPSTLLALTTAGHLLTIDSGAPGVAVHNVAVSGLQVGDSLHSIAFAQDGKLYGIAGDHASETTFDRLYTVDPTTGIATAGASLTAANVFSVSGRLGASFDPLTGNLRVIDDLAHSLEIDPATGNVTDHGSTPVFGPDDANHGVVVFLAGMAYTNAAPGATVSGLYGMDIGSHPAFIRIGGPQGNPSVDSGQAVTVAAAPPMTAFTIASGNAAYAVSNAVSGSGSILWAVNMGTGAQTRLGSLAAASPLWAIAPIPGAAGLTGTITGSVFFDPHTDVVLRSGDVRVRGATVFVDLNRNGRLDANEQPYSAVTDQFGNYRINHVPAGSYPVLEVGAGTTIGAPSSANRDFGFAVAAGADELAVGDPRALRRDPDFGNNPSNLGRAYVYLAQAGTRLAELTAPDPLSTDPFFPNQDDFGFAVGVSLDGSVGVGSPFRWEHAPVQNQPTPLRGVGFVYTGIADPQSVDLSDVYLPDNTLTDGELGLSVAAQFDRMFTFSGGVSGLDAMGTGQSFGVTASLDASKTGAAAHSYYASNVVAGIFDSITTGNLSGTYLAGDPDHAQVEFGTGSGDLLHDPNGGLSSFGTAVALFGRIAVVGAPGQGLGGVSESGAVYAFDLIGAGNFPPTPPTLLTTFADPAQTEDDHFGFAMARVGDHELLVGAPGDSTFGASAGAAYLFDIQTGALLETFYGPHPHAGADFGFSVAAVDDHTVAIGAPSTADDSDPGAVVVLAIAPIATVGSTPVTVNLIHHAVPAGRTIGAVENVATGEQVLGTWDPTGVDLQGRGGLGTPAPDAIIDWGDHTTSIGRMRLVRTSDGEQVLGSHTYAEGGTYPITITVTTGGNALPRVILSATAQVQDAPLRLTPRAVSAVEGAAVSHVLVGSFLDPLDPGRDPSDYGAAVQWGDGETSTSAGGMVMIQKAPLGQLGFQVYASKPTPYAEEGAATVTLTVNDTAGGSATATAHAVIADAPLTLSLAVPQFVEAQAIDQPVLVATFTDANPHGDPADFTATIRWGDGQVSSVAAGTVTIVPQAGAFQVLARKPSPYRAAGTNLVFQAVVRDRSASDRQHTLVAVGDAPLTLTLIAPSLVEGQPLRQVLVGTFTDANPNAVAGDFTANVDWGDGTSSTSAAGLVSIRAQTQHPGVFEVRASKRQPYAEEASNVPLHVTVTDRGGASDDLSMMLAVADAPLALTGVSFTATAGQVLTTQVASFTDLDPQGAVGDYTALIDWGDSAGGPPDVTPGTVRRTRSGTYTISASADHAYAAAGTYTVTVVVQDSGQQFATVNTARISA
jgi:PKD repeat protein